MAVDAGYIPAPGEKDLDKIVRAIRNLYENALGSSVLTGAATKAQQEAGTAADAYVAPATQQYHPAAGKAWAVITFSAGTPTLAANYNIASITDTATGRTTLTIGADFSSADYAVCCGSTVSTNVDAYDYYTNQAAGSVEVRHYESSTTLTDPVKQSVIMFGDR